MISKIRNRLTYIKRDDGASAVEFALMVPVLMAIIMGVIQFGLIFFSYISIVHAAREGVRWAALENTVSEIKTKAINAASGLNPALNESNISISVNGTPLTSGGTTIDMAGDPATVSIDYNSPVIVPFVFGSATEVPLHSSATQRIE